MLRKPQEESISTNRNKLPLESCMRPLTGIKELLTMAESTRGAQIELAWTTKIPEQVFVLDVQWDANMEDPFWALYEENAGQSKQVWCQSFAAADIELLYDILVMSCGAAANNSPTKNLSEIIKAQPKDDSTSSTNNKAATNSLSNQTVSLSVNQTVLPNPPISQNPIATAPGMSPAIDPKAAQNFDNINSAIAPGYAFPPGTMPMNPNFPMNPYNMPPMPMVYPPPRPANMPSPPANAIADWQYPVVNLGGNTPDLYNNQVSNSPARLSDSGAFSKLPIDTSLLNKREEISLVDLLIKAELLIEPVLAAALKIQDLIQAEKLSIEKATQLLKRYHSKGDAIENYIDSFISDAKDLVQKSKPSDNAVKKAKPKREDKEALTAFELLEQAGLLSSQDIKIAQEVSDKHGGDLVSILQAAQKLDEKTLAAAKICHALERDGLMKLEQCVILLNYCSRSRVSFDEAISELNWENPRK